MGAAKTPVELILASPMFVGFLCGTTGGLLAELLGLYRLRQESPSLLPAYYKSIFYWVVTGVMILAGGVIVVIYIGSGIELKPIVALNVGASAPLILGSLIKPPAQLQPGKTD